MRNIEIRVDRRRFLQGSVAGAVTLAVGGGPGKLCAAGKREYPMAQPPERDVVPEAGTNRHDDLGGDPFWYRRRR